ncbi:MAG TPA: hypothetical protein VFQ59_02420 [Candidatus Paceibacterota bacterium]|nr:hypothetical protein [Candidatus Paceibacterota bacterium]
MKIFHSTWKYFDRLEDRIRSRLSRRPILYALIGSFGIVLIWRGIWMLADDINMPGWVSLLLGVLVTVTTGLFVSFFIGDKIIISGIKAEKRVDEKTEEEIRKEERVLEEIKKEILEIKKEMEDNNNHA